MKKILFGLGVVALLSGCTAQVKTAVKDSAEVKQKVEPPAVTTASGEKYSWRNVAIGGGGAVKGVKNSRKKKINIT
jgi:hypothetical protein